MKTCRRYWLFQIPGIVIATSLLAIAAVWFGLPIWVCGAILAAWIAKDALLYPFLKRAYEGGTATATERLVGSTGVAAQALDPQGYVKVGAELWRARSASRIRAGESVSVAGVARSEALLLIVEPLAPEARLKYRNMKGDPKVLESLKDVLKSELTAINQSFLHARMCADWGYEGLGRKIRKESIVKMEHAEKLIDRILFLESMPNLRDTFALRIGRNVAQMHENDLAIGNEIAARANKGVETAAARSDDTSRELLESILAAEEEYIDWLEAQLQVIADAGLGLYLAQQMRR